MSGAIDADRAESMSVDDAWAAVQTGLNYVSWLAGNSSTGVAREDLVAEGGQIVRTALFDPSHGAQF
jgi:hypothetical protein